MPEPNSTAVSFGELVGSSDIWAFSYTRVTNVVGILASLLHGANAFLRLQISSVALPPACLLNPVDLTVNFYDRHDTRRALPIRVIFGSIYVLCTVAWAVDVLVLWEEAHQHRFSRTSTSSQQISEAGGALIGILFKLATAREACAVVTQYLFSDVLSLWRIYVVYGRPRWLRLTALSISVSSSALYIVDEVLRSQEVGSTGFKVAFTVVTLSVRGSAQVFSSLFIAKIIRKHQHEMKGLFPTYKDPSRRSRLATISVLYAILAMGLVYSCFWIAFVAGDILSLSSGDWKTWFLYIDALMCHISGIFPTLSLIVRAELISEHDATDVSRLVNTSMHFEPKADTEHREHLELARSSQGIQSSGHTDSYAP
ncbi:hypothetical protein MSAN_00339800 [Mycena sanguinolenta]|uniref:Uncharacterized protein n=1 Tax=Mycena sanguinolenta TaxID=230812 RepID=A0A8H6ZBG9_9AGAR|nr:hypothetical protein MSAN_00339800 [Mycena sanguinolenta]